MEYVRWVATSWSLVWFCVGLASPNSARAVELLDAASAPQMFEPVTAEPSVVEPLCSALTIADIAAALGDAPNTGSTTCFGPLKVVNYETAETEYPTSLPGSTAEFSGGSTRGNCFSSCRTSCTPCWTVRVGALFLDRSRPSGSTILTSGAAPGSPEILNANQMQANAGWGYDISAIRRNVFGTQRTLEARYFGVYGFNAGFGPVVAPTGSVIQYVAPLGNTRFPEIVSASSSSQLQSFELNTWRPTSRFLFPLVGFRYLDLTEHLSTTHNIGPGLNQAVNRVGSFNNLFGGQVGVDGLLYQRRRLSLGGVVKAGVYGVSASNSVFLSQNAGPSFASGANQGGAAFVGEMGWTAQYQLNRRWSLRTTYELLWLDGVALASDQVSASNPAFGQATVATNTVFYHGMFLGAEYRR